ncbi:MAG: DUF2007 domain-containing protein [Gemmatimonadota bacterium]|nr:MAG: DUF2007 domain-containing protein [Gemmatimonadota bacterium]
MSSDCIWKVIATYNSLMEAEIAAGRLDHVGIPRRIDQRGGVGLFGPGHGGSTVRGIALLVPDEQIEAAREALDLE